MHDLDHILCRHRPGERILRLRLRMTQEWFRLPCHPERGAPRSESIIDMIAGGNHTLIQCKAKSKDPSPQCLLLGEKVARHSRDGCGVAAVRLFEVLMSSYCSNPTSVSFADSFSPRRSLIGKSFMLSAYRGVWM